MDLTQEYLRFGAALVGVIALIGLLAVVARRFGLGTGVAARGGRGRRLGIVEVAAIDPKHRLLLLRRDTVEHLVLLGPDGGTVIERGIAGPSPLEPAGPKEPTL